MMQFKIFPARSRDFWVDIMFLGAACDLNRKALP